MIFGPRLAKGRRERTQRRTRVAGLRGAKLRPARPLQGRFSPDPSPQPSGRACDVEEQPSARGGCGLRHPFRVQIQNSRFKIQNYQIWLQPAKGTSEVKELQASAARGCGPLGPDGPVPTWGQPAAERTGGTDCKELQPSARGRLRAAGPIGPILQTGIYLATPAAHSRRLQ